MYDGTSDHLETPREWVECAVTGRDTFPIQAEGSGRDRVEATTIPWWLAAVAYEVYEKKYGNRQSLERLAERGGFGRQELLDLLKEAQ